MSTSLFWSEIHVFCCMEYRSTPATSGLRKNDRADQYVMGINMYPFFYKRNMHTQLLLYYCIETASNEHNKTFFIQTQIDNIKI